MASSNGPVWRAHLDAKRPAGIFGGKAGIPEGSAFVMESVLLVDGNTDSGNVTSSGTVTVTVSDSVLNAGVDLLTDKSAASLTQTTGLAVFKVTQAESSGWESGTYNGDVKYPSRNASRTIYWPLKLTVREARD